VDNSILTLSLSKSCHVQASSSFIKEKIHAKEVLNPTMRCPSKLLGSVHIPSPPLIDLDQVLGNFNVGEIDTRRSSLGV
jgi:hypothetical protein